MIPVSRETDRSEEGDDSTPDETLSNDNRTPSTLPGGRHTGDALHRTIEELLRMDDTGTVISDDAVIRSTVEKHLATNGIITRLSRRSSTGEGAVAEAVTAACNCVRGALTAGMELPGGNRLDKVAALAPGNRFPEMEFLLRLHRHWAHGFMDLVFRVPSTGNSLHPWRYHVLDWKSDTLPDFTPRTIAHCINERHYDLQARLYCLALDNFLRSILGTTYDPTCHLGGAVYLFLREHERAPLTGASVWTCPAQPESDREYILDKVHI